MNADKESYSGEWKQDKKEGKGVKVWNNGDKYDGEWKNDLREGKGTHCFSNGDKYVGLCN